MSHTHTHTHTHTHSEHSVRLNALSNFLYPCQWTCIQNKKKSVFPTACITFLGIELDTILRCHYTKSNPIDDHSNISSKRLQKQNFKPLAHYTCMQCGTSHLQTVHENILSHIILATYRKFTVATVRFTQNVSCNIYTHLEL